jgi:hypothetical protein
MEQLLQTLQGEVAHYKRESELLREAACAEAAQRNCNPCPACGGSLAMLPEAATNRAVSMSAECGLRVGELEVTTRTPSVGVTASPGLLASAQSSLPTDSDSESHEHEEAGASALAPLALGRPGVCAAVRRLPQAHPEHSDGAHRCDPGKPTVATNLKGSLWSTTTTSSGTRDAAAQLDAVMLALAKEYSSEIERLLADLRDA